MSAFALDTSRHVDIWDSAKDRSIPWFWDMLSPFAQGYTERALMRLANGHGVVQFYDGWRAPRFADLVPEALDAMLKDCEEAQRLWPHVTTTTEAGRDFYDQRQAMILAEFCPVEFRVDAYGINMRAAA